MTSLTPPQMGFWATRVESQPPQGEVLGAFRGSRPRRTVHRHLRRRAGVAGPVTRKTWVLAGAAVLAAVVAAGGVVATSGAKQATSAAQEPPANTAKVEKGTLSAMVSLDGTLTYRARTGRLAVLGDQPGPTGHTPSCPQLGQVISQGQVLYRVNDSPVVLLYGSTPAYRSLSAGATGADVAELNADLVALGYATSAQLSPTSSYFGSATTTALEKLQAALGVTQNGTLTLGQAVFEPTAVRVTTLSAQLGGSTQTGQTVIQGSSTTRQVQVALDASQQTDVAVGDKVTITLPEQPDHPRGRLLGGDGGHLPIELRVRRVELQLRCAGNGHLLVKQLGEQHNTDHHYGRHPVRPDRHGHLGSGPGASHHHHRQRAQRPGGTSHRAAGPVRRWLRRRGRRPRGDPPSRSGLARTVRRRRRAGTGHRLGAGHRPRSGGPGHMTYTPPDPPDLPSVAAGNGSATDAVQVPVLDVDNVTKSYPGEPPVQALRGVNLTIGEGELVGIVGPSGSGKTTLLQLMGTLDRPTRGHVRIAGLDVATMADDDVAYLRATRIGFIFQQFFLAEHAAVVDNVADGLLYAGIALEQRRQRAIDALDLVGLAQRPHARPTQLSGGQRQRVAIARALVGQPAIVLADEPTGNLDQATGQSILALIDQLHQAGSTIVVITHDPAIAERMPRKVEILDGHIVADTGLALRTDPRHRPLAPLAQPPIHAPQTAPRGTVNEEPS